MSTFHFTGRTSSGRLVKGARSADSADAVAAALQRERIVVSQIRRRSSLRPRWPLQSRRCVVSAKELAVFTRQLSVMLGAGVPIAQCLAMLATQVERPHVRAVIDDLHMAVQGGVGLADAMRRHPRVFGTLYTSMVAAGEVSGHLETVVDRLAMWLEKHVVLRGHVMSAIAYPAAVAATAALVVAAILWKVIPTFVSLFDGLGAALPLPTRLVIWVSDLSIVALPAIVLCLVGGGWGLRRYRADHTGRRVLDRLALGIPVVGGVIQKVAAARFCRTLATLVGSGVPILESLETTAQTTGNAVIEDAVMQVRDEVAHGQPLSAPLRQLRVFPPMVTHMVHIGETTGTLEVTLSKVADFYEEEVGVSAKGLVALLEPLMITSVGIVVGAIVVAMYLPIFDLVTHLAF